MLSVDMYIHGYLFLSQLSALRLSATARYQCASTPLQPLLAMKDEALWGRRARLEEWCVGALQNEKEELIKTIGVTITI